MYYLFYYTVVFICSALLYILVLLLCPTGSCLYCLSCKSLQPPPFSDWEAKESFKSSYGNMYHPLCYFRC